MERYRKISIAHDLTPRQRKVITELRRKALDELEKARMKMREVVQRETTESLW